MKKNVLLQPVKGSVAQSRFERSHFDFAIKSRIHEKTRNHRFRFFGIGIEQSRFIGMGRAFETRFLLILELKNIGSVAHPDSYVILQNFGNKSIKL